MFITHVILIIIINVFQGKCNILLKQNNGLCLVNTSGVNSLFVLDIVHFASFKIFSINFKKSSNYYYINVFQMLFT